MDAERFRFGENWREYLKHVDSRAVEEAENGLLRLVPAKELVGADFLDIGCGSGLHSLAALRMGANVTAIDIDPDSVAATHSLIPEITVREQDVFEASGQFDIVYSWGVLHHTGDMWNAIRHAATLVRPGGLFAIALYRKTPMCGAWAKIKRFYSGRGKVAQSLIRAPYSAAVLLRVLAGGTNPVRYVREYKSKRGMNFSIDIHDWLGGFPYESAAPDDVVAFFRTLGFEVVSDLRKPSGMGLLGTGCDEFTFRRINSPSTG